jgi:SAM-dependent methyltransferase
MDGDTTSSAVGNDGTQVALNAEEWARGEQVELYANTRLRPVEAVVIERYRERFAGRVLELGCGAGRLTGHLLEAARVLDAIDLSPTMVTYCRQTYPRGTFSVGDLRDLSGFASEAYDVVFAPFNVLDVLDDASRRQVLSDIRRLLAADGLLVMSSHNRDYLRRPLARVRLVVRLWVGAPRRPLASLRNLPRRLRNRQRLRKLQRDYQGFAILNDEAHDFSMLHYYISRDAQEQQISGSGFRFVESLDLDGRPVRRPETAAHCPELHYVARR